MIDQTKLNNLLALAKPNVCEVLAVYWSDSETNYYSWTRYDDLIQYSDIPLRPIEARIINGGFHQYEINGDVRTENIPLTFDDIDRNIRAKFKAHGTVRCELFTYYPDVDLLVSSWWGQLNKPEIWGLKTLQTTASNGFRSRELQMPRRPRPEDCTTIFGGKFTDATELYTNGCPYDRQLPGGTNGLLDPTTNQPFVNCDLTEAACLARFGHTKYHLGFKVKANPIVSDPRTGFIATSRNAASILKQPIRVIAGRKRVRGLNLLAWRPEPPDYVRGIWEIGEGNNEAIFNITLGGITPRPEHTAIRSGGRGQPGTGYDQTLNFSGTGFFTSVYGQPDSKIASQTTGPQIEAACSVHGFNEVAVYSTPTAFVRTFTVNLAWWILECHTNHRFGFGYSDERFYIPSFIETATWAGRRVRFTHPNGTHYDSSAGESRSSFSAVLEPRASHEQITDMCRSGRISIPFQHDGKYHVTPIAAVEQSVLNQAKIFTDKGDGRNIIWENGMPAINLSQIADEKLCNHVVLTFEDGTNGDVERPITVDDQNQKLLAGKAMGDNNFAEIPKRYSAFGIRFLNEAIRLAYSLLWFGEFDTGGIKNNLRAELTVPCEQVLGLKKYDIIKIESDLLADFESPEGNLFEFFRLQNLRKIGGGQVRLTAQAYNKEVYETFETVLADENYVSVIDPLLPVNRLQFGDAPYYENGNIIVPPITTN